MSVYHCTNGKKTMNPFEEEVGAEGVAGTERSKEVPINKVGICPGTQV